MSSAITIAAVGTAVSAYSANQQNKNANRAMNQQQQAQQADLAFRQEQYDRYLGLYGGLEEKQAHEAMSDQPLDYDKNAAAIKQNFADAGRNSARAMSMRGMAGSGTDMGMMRGQALGQGAALSGAYSQGLINRRNLGLQLTGKGDMRNAANGLEGGMQNMANYQGGMANFYNQAAMNAGQGFQQGLGNLGSAINDWNNRPQASQQVVNTVTQAPNENLQPIQPRDTSQYLVSW